VPFVEAMASDTPAISMARSAAPEVIDEGPTGFLVNHVDEMVVGSASCRLLRTSALRRSHPRPDQPRVMADAYLRLYESVEASLTGLRQLLRIGSNEVLRSANGRVQPGWLRHQQSHTRSAVIDAGVAETVGPTPGPDRPAMVAKAHVVQLPENNSRLSDMARPAHAAAQSSRYCRRRSTPSPR
jgi:hypothetical protein